MVTYFTVQNSLTHESNSYSLKIPYQQGKYLKLTFMSVIY